MSEDYASELLKVTIDGMKCVFDVAKPIAKAAVVLLVFCAKGIYGKATQKAAKEILMKSKGILPMAVNEKDYQKFKKLAKKLGLPFVSCKYGKDTRLVTMRSEDSALINRIIKLTGITHLSDEEFEDVMKQNKVSANDNREVEVQSVSKKENDKAEKENDKTNSIEDEQNIAFEEVGEISADEMNMNDFIGSIGQNEKSAPNEIFGTNPTQALSEKKGGLSELESKELNKNLSKLSDDEKKLAQSVGFGKIIQFVPETYLDEEIKKNKDGKKFESANAKTNVKEQLKKTQTARKQRETKEKKQEQKQEKTAQVKRININKAKRKSKIKSL